MRDAVAILKEYWGYEAFRPLQQEIIDTVLSGRDALAILPTGGGKSICFQVPALATEGICLVISPLIALMKDQVENLKKRGIPALMIHSGMQRADVVQTFRNATHSYFKFLYISPERLETGLFKEYLPALQVSLIAVDEAHCISQWGYDFRPSYQRIAALRQLLPKVPVLALTASATPEVQRDICEKLALVSPAQFRQSFARENLSYSVFQPESKVARCIEILKKVPGTGIVYCKSRKRTVEIAGLLRQQGISAAFYHAGLGPEERSQKQAEWIANKVRVMVCTNAFGMGIDKPDVRAVVHVDVPDCLENYYQEAGRAGRDGKKSYAVLLYDRRDLEELSLLHHTRYPDLEKIRRVYDALVNFLQIPVYTGQDKSFTFRFEELVRNFKLDSNEAFYSLKALETDGWFDYNEKNFTPSTLQFVTNKSGLYEFYKSYPQHELLLTTLLRTYEGIFDFPVFIQEMTIARLLKKDVADIGLQLKTVASFGIIRYQPHNPAPQLIFRKNRVKADELSFSLMPYYKRRDAFRARTAAMTAYLQATSCRSQLISDYFGEKNAAPCGSCDNCLKKKNGPLTGDEFREISSRVLAQLAGAALPVDTLLSRLPAVKKEKAWEVIAFLQSENKIRVNENGELVANAE